MDNSSYLPGIHLSGFAFCPSLCPPEEFPLEIWMETSSLCCLLPPLIALSTCSLSWKRHLDASLFEPGAAEQTDVSLTLSQVATGRGLFALAHCSSRCSLA